MEKVQGGYRIQEINTFKELKGMVADGVGFWSLADGEQGSADLRRMVGDLAASINGPSYFGPLEGQWEAIDAALEEEDLSLWLELAPSAGVSYRSADGPFIRTNFNRFHIASHQPRSSFEG